MNFAAQRPATSGVGPLRIGQVATLAGVKVDTVRFYERRGVLPLAPRRASGYRMFLPETVARIQFAKQAQALGFSLDEIVELLELFDRKQSSCGDLMKLGKKTLDRLDAKLAVLTSVRDQLAGLLSACEGAASSERCAPLVQIGRRLSAEPHEGGADRRPTSSHTLTSS